MKKYLFIIAIIVIILIISGFVVRGTLAEAKAQEISAPVEYVELFAADGRKAFFPITMKEGQMKVGWYETKQDAARSRINSEDIEALAAVMYIEARGLSTREVAMVGWCVLNRVDRGDGSIRSICYSNQFALYHTNSAYHNSSDYAWLAEDILIRYYLEKMGETNVGRVLPSNYYWFTGDGKHNYFRCEFYGSKQLETLFWMYNPYEK